MASCGLKKGLAISPTPKPYSPDPAIPCNKCAKPNYLRPGKYGPWLGCSNFPKCRGRGDFKKLPEEVKAELLKKLEAHQKLFPVIIVKTLDGQPLTSSDGKPLPSATPPGQEADANAPLEQLADELGV